MKRNTTIILVLCITMIIIVSSSHTDIIQSQPSSPLSQQSNNSQKQSSKNNQIDSYPNFNYFFDYVWNTSIKELAQQKNKELSKSILAPTPLTPKFNFSQSINIAQRSPNIKTQNSIQRAINNQKQNINSNNNVTYHIIYVEQAVDKPKHKLINPQHNLQIKEHRSDKKQNILKCIEYRLNQALKQQTNLAQDFKLKPVSIIKQYN